MAEVDAAARRSWCGRVARRVDEISGDAAARRRWCGRAAHLDDDARIGGAGRAGARWARGGLHVTITWTGSRTNSGERTVWLMPSIEMSISST